MTSSPPEHNLLILSDSHGHTRNLRDILARQLKKPDMVLFLGDGLRDLGCLGLQEKGISLLAVKGNCDSYSYPEPDDPDERLLTVGNIRICMMHGHTRHVKGGWLPAAAHAARQGADLLLFGHTHEPIEEYFPAGTPLGGVPLEKPLTVFNPGTVGGGWGKQATFGTLNVRGETFLLSHGKV